MKVKYATQIFSHSVAAGIGLLTTTSYLPSEAVHTAEFVGHMDELFDSFNSLSLHNVKEFACAVSKSSRHTELWQDKLKWIRSWQFFKSDLKKITPACKKGWLITINAGIQLWEYLHNQGQNYLFTNRLNQDCLENTFLSIRRKGGFCDNPNCLQFQSAICTSMLTNLLKATSLANCEDGDDNILTTVLTLEKEKQILEETTNCPFVEESGENVINEITFDQLSLMEKNAMVYVTGYLAYKILNKFPNCAFCTDLLVTSECLADDNLLIYFKQYNFQHGRLKYLTDAFIATIAAYSEIFYAHIEKFLVKPQLFKNFNIKLSKVSMIWLHCDGYNENHINAVIFFFINLYLKVMTYHKIKSINSKFQRTNPKKKIMHFQNM